MSNSGMSCDEIEEAGDCDISPSETMTCDIMPTICEDPGAITGDKASLEDMMMTMLDERDKLVEHLKATQEQCEMYKNHLEDSLKEADNLRNQMELAQTTDVSILSKNLNDMQKRVIEQEEEISELKAERNNTRLLLEHLECLVSRHERSLRMTVVKRQTHNSGGVSSEVEVLKALKSLFEHHKALDEKMREKLKSSFEKCQHLEEECGRMRREKEELRIALEQTKITPIVNGPVDPKDQDMVKKLQIALESQDKEVVELKERLAENSSFISQISEQLASTQRDLKQTGEEKTKYYRDYHESNAQKEDMEKRIVTLETRYLNAQRESTQLHDQLDKLHDEIQSKNAKIALNEEKLEKMEEDLILSDKNLKEMVERMESLPEVQAELVQKTAALNQIQQKKGSIEEQLQQMKDQMEESERELERARQREKMNEEHNQRLTSTVDKLLVESNERLQLHLKERMVVLHERNVLQTELENIKKLLEEQYEDKSKQMETIRILRQELDSSKIESKSLENKLRYSLDMSGIANNVASGLLPVVSENGTDLGLEMDALRNNGNTDDLQSGTVLRQNKGRLVMKEDPDRVLTLNEQEWEKMHQAQIVADIRQAFAYGQQSQQLDHLPGVPYASPRSHTESLMYNPNNSIQTSDYVSSSNQVVGSSPSSVSGTDEETLHLCRALQDQLDAIDKEMQLIQEEKQNTEMRFEELESRIDSGSLDNLDMSTPPPSSSTFDSPVWPFHQRTDPRAHMTLPSSFNRHATGVESKVNEWSGCRTVEKPPESPHGSQYTLYNGYNQESFRQNERLEYGNNFTLPTRPNKSVPGSMLKKKQGSFKGSLGKFFGKKDKYRKEGHDAYNDGGASESEIGSQESLSGSMIQYQMGQSYYSRCNQNDFDGNRSKKIELLHAAIDDQIPFAQWSGPTVVSWLELWVGMPAWYVNACRANVKSGAIMSALSDSEIQREIGISNHLHRLKLRLAIQEIVEYTSCSLRSRIGSPLIFGEMNHEWIGNEWLQMIGLPQYKSTFMECLVDARMLSHLNKRDMQRQLKVVDSFHRNSILCGLRVLAKVNYCRKDLERLQKEAISSKFECNLMVWSNRLIGQWLFHIGLEDYAQNIEETGVHGGILSFDSDFSCHSLALILRVAGHPNRARTMLEREYTLLRDLPFNFPSDQNNSASNQNNLQRPPVVSANVMRDSP